MKKYVEIKTTDFEITSGVIEECIRNNWNELNLGRRDSIFNEYYIYFDE